ncbi:tetratricopeptide (TPR) repeat protein [Saccharothrix ecbatanensis]|uniref:Tetratricopeptide (TPR) repeat protein n=1 Tax=Saccharothrix ecbatanensis TaxID=1105145 RepID=A0A7W9LYL6_9PSEU|nr:tetratricopeptide repeat protein [Saccharothrix ecbatanensis]MBB5800757.1 tetratricopeptide (TPR) repeat protein [Saccharothrix ecbatanensis]
MSDPKTAFAQALARLRERLPDVSDEALARRASAIVLPSGRRVAVNARRLGEWLGGQSVPRDFDAVLAVVMATGGVPKLNELRDLWRTAHQDRRQTPKSGRVVVGRPPTDAAALRDRPGLADAIDAALRTADVRQVLLTGPGGAGKSQLATAAFHRARADVVVWAGARTRQSVLTAYARAWRALVKADAGDDDEAQADLFLAWLRSTTTSWLVVLDDVDDPAELSGLWPAGEAGRSLITTQRRDAALRRPDAQVVSVGMFDPDEATAYLSARLAVDPRHDPDRLATLAEALGHYPLALSQAAAFLIDTGMDVSTYLDLLSDRRQRVADLFPPTSPADEHQDTVANTVRLAVERAKAIAANATDVLGLVSVLAPDGIPESVLLDDGRNLLALRALHRLNLVTHDSRVEAHALVQRAARDLVGDLTQVAVAAADAIEREWSTADPDTAAALYRNTEVLRSVAGEHLWAGGMHPVLRRLGQHLADIGRPAAARDVARHLLTRAVSPRDVVVLRTQVAKAIGDLGDPATALDHFGEIRDLAERKLGQTDLDTLWVRFHQATYRLETGLIETALGELTSLADACDLPAAHPLKIAAEDNRALCMGLSGDITGARDAASALHAVLRRELGPRHRQTLRVLLGLGRWIGEIGDARSAVAAYQEAADGLEEVAPGHHDTLIARHNLAYWRAVAGDLTEAIAEFETAAADAERTLGEDHPTTLTYKSNLVFWRGVAGDRTAVADLATLRESVEAVLGANHPRVLRIRQQRAELLHRTGQREEAVDELQVVLAEMSQVQGANHPRTREAADLLSGWQ